MVHTRHVVVIFFYQYPVYVVPAMAFITGASNPLILISTPHLFHNTVPKQFLKALMLTTFTAFSGKQVHSSISRCEKKNFLIFVLHCCLKKLPTMITGRLHVPSPGPHNKQYFWVIVVVVYPLP